jgi:hypothetical protein
VIARAEFWADVHAPTVVVALLAAVLVVVAIGFVLSPAGRPDPPRRRTGGLSRAIADWTDGEGGAQ